LQVCFERLQSRCVEKRFNSTRSMKSPIQVTNGCSSLFCRASRSTVLRVGSHEGETSAALISVSA
jgi:hypothetical protein